MVQLVDERAEAGVTRCVEPAIARPTARVLERALARGGDFAELYAEERHGFALSLDDGRVERPQGGRERGACVRVVQGDSTYYGHVDGLAEEDLLRVAESASQAVRGEAREPAAAERGAGRRTGTPIELAPRRSRRAQGGGAARLRRARPRRWRREVAQVRDRLRARRAAQVEVFNSDGPRRRRRPHARAARRPGRGAARRPRRDRQRHPRRPRGLRADRGRPRAGGRAGGRARALTLLDAVDAPTGRLPVVVGNAFGGVLLHEAVGHGLEADAVQKRASVYAGRLGEQLAEPFVTAYDDGRRPNEWGSDGIDDEGTPTQRTTVIEDGRLTSLPLRPADRAPRRRRVDRQRPARVVPPPADPAHDEHLLRARATPRPEDLIGEIERGLYAVSFGGGQVEPATGDFVFGVSEGYLIEDGKVTAPVRGATLIGNGLEALRGDRRDRRRPRRSPRGYCGKAGQSRARRRRPAARAHPRADRRRHRREPRRSVGAPGASRPPLDAGATRRRGLGRGGHEPAHPRLRGRGREPERRRRPRRRRARVRRRARRATPTAPTSRTRAWPRSPARRGRPPRWPTPTSTPACPTSSAPRRSTGSPRRRCATGRPSARSSWRWPSSAPRARATGVTQVEDAVYSDAEGSVALANSRGFSARLRGHPGLGLRVRVRRRGRRPDDRPRRRRWAATRRRSTPRRSAARPPSARSRSSARASPRAAAARWCSTRSWRRRSSASSAAMLSADAVQRGRSLFADREGDEVADAALRAGRRRDRPRRARERALRRRGLAHAGARR